MIHERLAEIQQTLKAPKNQRNSFGNYNYRSCEDILEAVKPLLGAFYLTISDEIVMLGDRFYVKATATISDGKQSISNSAYARESLDKKGMDSSQVTGATSSYARKYALNGLFAIDDTKDADTMDNTKETSPVAPKTASTSEYGLCPKCGGSLNKIVSKKDGKEYLKCENGTFKNGVAGGCTFFKLDKPISHDEDIY